MEILTHKANRFYGNGRSKVIKCLMSCLCCNCDISKSKSQLKKSKHKMYFCNKSCRMKYFNLNMKSILKNRNYRRSRAEDYLYGLIHEDFPKLEILQNSKNLLTSGLEIDIFIKDYNLAIELNGPVHYIPIYGNEKFNKIQDRDIIKQLECQKGGYNLIIIDISQLRTNKKSESFLSEYYEKYIKPILN